jgi:thiosulfate/3-mercaptopyruvate sulfurtransferase
MPGGEEERRMAEGDVPALVSTDWLAGHLQDPHVRVADVRWYLAHLGKNGQAEYARGHIPGAVFLDLDTQLSGPRGSGPGRHPLPAPAAFAEAMSSAGIGAPTHVVAYDDAGGAVAARLWWLLRYFGHPRVSVLDGGIARWAAEGRPLEATPAPPSPLPVGAGPSSSVVRSTGAGAPPFVPRPHPEWAVDKETVGRLRHDPRAVLLDARAPERYEGRTEPVDPRPGHIPGARSAPFAGNLRAEEAPRLKPAGELRAHYEGLGATRAGQVVVYCGSGVNACHDLLALHLAGLPGGLLYEGSWSDWSADPSLPAATGPEPG